MEKIRRDPRPNSQLFANPPVQSVMAFDYFIFFQALGGAMSFSLNFFSSSANHSARLWETAPTCV